MTYEPLNEDDNQPATKGDVKAAVNTLRQDLPEIVTDAVENVVDDKVTGLRDDMAKWKSDIHKDNDKVIKKLDTFLTEQAALTASDKHQSKRLDNLEDFAEEAADIAGVEFEKVVN